MGKQKRGLGEKIAKDASPSPSTYMIKSTFEKIRGGCSMGKGK